MFSRVLLLLTGLLLVLMPITERVFTSDGFILGGHDLELTLIGIFAFCGLVALCAHRVVMLPALLRIFGQFRRPVLPSSAPAQPGSPAHTIGSLQHLPGLSSPACGALPLRI